MLTLPIVNMRDEGWIVLDQHQWGREISAVVIFPLTESYAMGNINTVLMIRWVVNLYYLNIVKDRDSSIIQVC